MNNYEAWLARQTSADLRAMLAEPAGSELACDAGDIPVIEGILNGRGNGAGRMTNDLDPIR